MNQGSKIGNIFSKKRSGLEELEYFPENAIRVRGLGIFSRKRDQGSKIRIFYRKRDQGSKIGNIFRKRDQGSRIGNISQKTRSGFEDWEYYPENAPTYLLRFNIIAVFLRIECDIGASWLQHVF